MKSYLDDLIDHWQDKIYVAVGDSNVVTEPRS